MALDLTKAATVVQQGKKKEGKLLFPTTNHRFLD